MMRSTSFSWMAATQSAMVARMSASSAFARLAGSMLPLLSSFRASGRFDAASQAVQTALPPHRESGRGSFGAKRDAVRRQDRSAAGAAAEMQAAAGSPDEGAQRKPRLLDGTEFPKELFADAHGAEGFNAAAPGLF